MIAFERRAVRGLRDRHARVIGQQLLHETGMRGIQMLDHHEGHSAHGNLRVEETAKRLQPTRRGADGDDRKCAALG